MNKLLLSGLLLFSLSSCGTDNTYDDNQQEKTEKVMQEADAQIGLPNIVNFQQKKLFKMILEECDKEDLVCYVYLHSQYTGKLVFIGKCIGYGIPFSAQFTNPDKLVWRTRGGWHNLPQADPNGLFMPTSSSATWLMMLDKDNKPRVVYLEPEIVVSPFELSVN